MTEILFYILVAINTALLVWGLRQKENIYQCPFFMGGIFAIFILPQAIALINNPGGLRQEDLQTIFAMASLCLAMIWFGYKMGNSREFRDKVANPENFSEKKMFQGGIAFVCVAYFFHFKILKLPEEIRNESNWFGIITVYYFFRCLIYPGFTIIFLRTLASLNWFNLMATLLAGALPLNLIIFEGRREVTATFLLTIGLSLFFKKKWCPPRLLVSIALFSTMIAIPLIGIYRGVAKNRDWAKLSEVNFKEEFLKYMKEGETLELRNAGYMIQYALETNSYALGAGYWDAMVFRFVPAQFLGKNFKDSLMIRPRDLIRNELESRVSYKIPTGLTYTGIGDAFLQFGFLGSLFFFLLSFFFKKLWIKAASGNLYRQIFYIQLISPAMLTATHDTVGFLPNLTFNILFLGILGWYAKKNIPRKTLRIKE